MPIAHACFVLDRVRMAGPSYAGLGSGSGLVGEGSSELGSELQNCWVAFEHAGDGGCFFGEPSASSSSGSVSESSSYGVLVSVAMLSETLLSVTLKDGRTVRRVRRVRRVRQVRQVRLLAHTDAAVPAARGSIPHTNLSLIHI